MASTTPTNIDSSIPEIWARQVLRTHERAGFWGRFVGGPGSGMPIIQMSELLNKPGDLIHIQVTNPLSGAGITGDTAVLEGNEENLTTSEMKVSPLLYRHGVRTFRRANKKSMLDLRSEAKMRLAEWGAEKMDDVRFAQFTASSLASPLNGETYTPNVLVAGGGTTKADVAATDKITVDVIRQVRYTLLSQKAKPFKVNGLPFWAMVISPEVEYDLKADTTYDNYVLSAASRGMDNPVFTGAIANVDGIVLYPHFNVPVGTDGGGASVRYATNLAFGAEFAVEGLDENPYWAEKQFDYDNELGVAYGFAFQPRRALELSSVQVLTAAAVPA